jgi:hypothetical protein
VRDRHYLADSRHLIGSEGRFGAFSCCWSLWPRRTLSAQLPLGIKAEGGRPRWSVFFLFTTCPPITSFFSVSPSVFPSVSSLHLSSNSFSLFASDASFAHLLVESTIRTRTSTASSSQPLLASPRRHRGSAAEGSTSDGFSM